MKNNVNLAITLGLFVIGWAILLITNYMEDMPWTEDAFSRSEDSGILTFGIIVFAIGSMMVLRRPWSRYIALGFNYFLIFAMVMFMLAVYIRDSEGFFFGIGIFILLTIFPITMILVLQNKVIIQHFDPKYEHKPIYEDENILDADELN